MPTRPAGADRIVLSGDLQDFDNTAFLPLPQPLVERLLYIGPAPSRPEFDPYYFLSKAPLSTAHRTVTVERTSPEKLASADFQRSIDDPSLCAIILDWAASDDHLKMLEKYCRSGKTLIFCASQPVDPINETQRVLRALTGSTQLSVTEAKTKDFALLGVIDFQSPLFRPFADVRFSDFSKIRFWSHRIIESSEMESAGDRSWRALAKFDDGSPAILHQQLGQGSLWILAAGWDTRSSQLGLSSKFVPLLAGMLDPTGRSRSVQSIYYVGQAIPIGEIDQSVAISDSSGKTVEVEKTAGQIKLTRPDLYWIKSGSARRQIAVQVPESESHLTELGNELFEQYGVPLGKIASDAQRLQSARQLQTAELESRQKIWQWLLLAGIIVLIVETGLAGWLARKSLVAAT